MLEKQSEIQLAKTEWKEVQDKFYEERKQSVIADFKIHEKYPKFVIYGQYFIS